MEFKYYREPGFVYDLIFVFTLHFNYESILSTFQTFDKEDSPDYLAGIESDFFPISDDVRLFFTLDPRHRTFLSFCFFSCQSAASLCSFDLDVLIDQINDREAFVRKLVRFWFPSFELPEDLSDLLAALSPVIDASKLSDSVKCSLYSFLVNPDRMIDSLVAALKEKRVVLEKEYALRRDDLEAASKKYASEEIFGLVKRKMKILSPDPEFLPFTLTLLHRIDLWVRGEDTVDFVLFGIDCEDGIRSDPDSSFEPDVRAFGEILSEPNRLEMLRLIRERGEVSQKDLERNLELTGPTTYYHLAMMQRAKMLSPRWVGRFVFYRLNPVYFEKVAEAVRRMGNI